MLKLDTYENMFLELLKKEFPEMKEKISDENELLKKVHDMKEESIKSLVKIVKESTLKDIERMYQDEVEGDDGRRFEIMQKWNSGFIYLQGAIKISEEVSMSLVDTLNEDENMNEENRRILAFLLKLHAKSIQMGKEVFSLLKYGHPDGALARWRSLHENTVIFRLLSSKIKDSNFTANIIDRFICYSYIKEYIGKVSKGYINVDEETMNKLKINKKEILLKYGKDLTKPNMWAKPLFKGRSKIQFHDLEKMAEMDILNTFYKQANSHVHTSPDGMYDSLSFSPEINQAMSYLYGGSNYGLEMPAGLTAISITQITASLLLFENKIDRRVMVEVLCDIQMMAIKEFF